MIEDDDTRLIFLDPEDFGSEVTFKPNAADSFTCLALFDARPLGDRQIKGAQVRHHEGAQVIGNTPQLRCRTSDLGDKVKAGRCQVEADGRQYNVFAVKPDSTGFSTVILRVDE